MGVLNVKTGPGVFTPVPAGYPGVPGPTGPAGADGPEGPAGPAGADGAGTPILSGSGAPDAALGAVGDYYEDTTAGVMYGPKSASGWGAQQRPTVANTPNTNGSSVPDAGCRYRFTRAGRIVGCRYQRLTTTDATLTIKAWNDTTQAVVASIADTRTATTGAFTVTFPTPVMVGANETMTFTYGGAGNAPPRNSTVQTVAGTTDVTFLGFANNSVAGQYPASTYNYTLYVEPIYEPNEAWPVTIRTVPGYATQVAVDGKQPLDADLTTIAGLTASTDNIIQSSGGAWASRTPAQIASTIPIFTDTVKGLAPPVGAYDPTKYLNGNGQWTVPAGGGGGITTEDAVDAVAAALVAGSNVTITYNDAANTITIAATGGGGGSGLPAGGTDEQVLVKNSSTDGDASWKTLTPTVVKATEPVAADYGLASIPVGAVWIQSA